MAHKSHLFALLALPLSSVDSGFAFYAYEGDEFHGSEIHYKDGLAFIGIAETSGYDRLTQLLLSSGEKSGSVYYLVANPQDSARAWVNELIFVPNYPLGSAGGMTVSFTKKATSSQAVGGWEWDE
ncbi:hypothetical protein BGW36DRAFT_363656 [Talaromyces proteolyticus]|uniref:Uncharacterized protein n=1 Tax=Talaromyces proteolyticus TaxID=1131652 RepID=A0AAD4KHJ1_9EURO|nr:uncharacterized protein BGW36DRAFT_363656 [Talaromyces proteolyticus]KAH8691324.1 hypothetical protein BGW36DRAFT_363656 [Talaromyces proteolyticus]